jgi:hypothetical protein
VATTFPAVIFSEVGYWASRLTDDLLNIVTPNGEPEPGSVLWVIVSRDGWASRLLAAYPDEVLGVPDGLIVPVCEALAERVRFVTSVVADLESL